MLERQPARPRRRLARRLHARSRSWPITSTSRSACAMSGRIASHPEAWLSDARFQTLIDNLHRASEVCRAAGFEPVLHPHAGTYIETAGEIARVMDAIDPSLLGLCLDTGHFRFGGADPTQAVHDYHELIRHVHIKDCRSAVIDERRGRRQGPRRGPQPGCLLRARRRRFEDRRGHRGAALVRLPGLAGHRAGPGPALDGHARIGRRRAARQPRVPAPPGDLVETPLGLMARTTPTQYWNDSCAIAELEYAVANGAVGATSNPTIVGEVLKKEVATWLPRIRAIRDERPAASDVDITWQVIEEMAVRGAAILAPVFERVGRAASGGCRSRPNPTDFRDAPSECSSRAVASPASPRTCRSSSRPPRPACRRSRRRRSWGSRSTRRSRSPCPRRWRWERPWSAALERREAAGLDVVDDEPGLHPDDRPARRLDEGDLRARRHHASTRRPRTGPASPSSSGRPRIYRERGYRTRLLAAAYRHHLHWSELIGGDISLTIPYAWQRRFNASSIEVRPRFDDPVPAALLDELQAPDPRLRPGLRARRPGRRPSSTATARRCAPCAASSARYWDLVRTIDDVLLPNPDVRA